MRARLQLLSLVALAVLGCNDGSIGTTRPDAASDGGIRIMDSAVAPDASVPDAAPADSGVPDTAAPDTGSPPIDSGTPPVDGGPAPDASGTPLAAGMRTVTVVAAGVSRDVLLYVPASWSAGGPGMVALHGNGDDAANFLAWSGLRATADAEGLAIAAPQAISGHFMGVDWDAYTTPVATNGDMQVALAAADLLRGGAVAPNRLYVLGHSQGGFLAFHLAMAYSEDFAAAHVASAGSPLGAGLVGTATRKIPIDLLIGSGDGLVTLARETRDQLVALGFDHRYTEVPGAGHCCPIMGRTSDIWSWLSARAL